jgi:phage I-like protein
MSYLVDLSKYTFDEAGPSWIQAFPLGAWQHPQHGEIKITPERVKRFAENTRNRVRGQDLNIDYDHKGGEAAGWVRAAEDRGNEGLWLQVDWTPTARMQLSEKKYRYFSPEYDDEWEPPHQPGTKYQDVLFGGALTNRPFLKGIVPINLSEAFASALEGDTVGPEKTPPGTLPVPPVKDKKKDAPTQLSEADILALPGIKALVEQNKQLAEKVSTLETRSAADAARVRLAEMNQPVNGRVLAPAVIDVAAQALTDPSKSGDALVTILQHMRDGNAVVELGERGGQRTSNVDPNATKQFMDLVAKIQSEQKVDYIAAVQIAQNTNRALAEAYSNATMQSVEG